MTCTFFGHRDCAANLSQKLGEVLTDLICNKKVDTFYVGNHGNFDRIVLNTLIALKREYPQIIYSIVLAYMPTDKKACDNTLLPEGIENIPKKYAVKFRNIRMINKFDYVVTYVNRISSGAYKMKNTAIQKGKNVIELQ